MAKLTKRVVDEAAARDKPYFVWCSDLSGFGVRVFPTGKKVYYADYRVERSRRRMTIGQHGKITTDEARKLAIATMGSVVKGDDPLIERKTRRKSMTVSELCDRYMSAAGDGLLIARGGRTKKASTLEIDRGRIERHIKPLLGSKLLIDLAAPDIVRFIRDVTAGKTAVKNRSGKNGARVEVSGGAGTAARTVGFLGGILSYAVAEGLLSANPVKGVPRPGWTPRTRRLTAEEYRALGNALAAEESQFETPQAITGAWLIALTGCRLGEIEKLKKTEVDAEAGCFRLGDSKTGASVRPVGQVAFEMLRQHSVDVSDNLYVLPALRQDGHYRGMAGAWGRLMKRAGLEGVTPHTMRHSFASVAGDLGFAESTIAAMLGHAASTVTSRYVHRLDSVMVAAANKVAAEVYRQMTGKSANVLQMPNRNLAQPAVLQQ